MPYGEGEVVGDTLECDERTMGAGTAPAFQTSII